MLEPGIGGHADVHRHRLVRDRSRGAGVLAVRQVQVRQDDARRIQGHSAQPGERLEVRPLQDFSASSDIDWSVPIAEVDQQLYAKYGLNPEEIAFIEAKAQPMA